MFEDAKRLLDLLKDQSIIPGGRATFEFRNKTWLAEEKDVYIYFNNDAEGWAVKNALSLLEIIH